MRWRRAVADLTEPQLAGVAEVFKLLGEPNRLRIVLACLDGAREVGEISGGLGLSQSLTSHHLRLLRTARLLRAERRGRHVAYAIDDDHVRGVLRNMVAHFVEPHDHEHDTPAGQPAGSTPETQDLPEAVPPEAVPPEGASR